MSALWVMNAITRDGHRRSGTTLGKTSHMRVISAAHRMRADRLGGLDQLQPNFVMLGHRFGRPACGKGWRALLHSGFQGARIHAVN